MKIALGTVIMFILGTIIGITVGNDVIFWVAEPVRPLLVDINVGGGLVMRSNFALGCGALFASARLVSSSLRWCAFYLLFGMAVSGGVAFFNRIFLAGVAKDMMTLNFKALVMLQNLPSLRVPIIGTLAILGLRLVIRTFTGPNPAVDSHQ